MKNKNKKYIIGPKVEKLIFIIALFIGLTIGYQLSSLLGFINSMLILICSILLYILIKVNKIEDNLLDIKNKK